MLKFEVLLCIVVADIFHHLPDEIQLAGWEQTRLDIVADKVAECTAEILVARVAQETARVGEHTHKAT